MALRAHAIGTLALASFVVAGCEDRTQIMVVSDTDFTVPERLERIEFEVEGPEGEVQRSKAELERIDLPAVLALSHEGGPLGPFEITAIGKRGSETVVRRRARTFFVEGRTLMLRMDLVRRCAGVSCGEGRTCTPNGCRSVEVPPDSLPPWPGSAMRRDGSTMRPDGGMDGGDPPSDGGRDAAMDARMPDGAMDARMPDGAMDARMPDGAMDARMPDGAMDARMPDDGGPTDAEPVDGGDGGADMCASSCDDGVACTIDECLDGSCAHTPDDSACDDGVACTVDTCTASGCTNEPDDRSCPRGQLCDPSSGCTSATTFTYIYDNIVSPDCSPCHTTGDIKGDLDMSSRAVAYSELVDVTAVCGSGNIRVIPYDADNSLLWRKVSGVDLCGDRMPRDSTPLSASEIDAIAEWIEAGAADN